MNSALIEERLSAKNFLSFETSAQLIARQAATEIVAISNVIDVLYVFIGMGSNIKAVLKHPAVHRDDLAGDI